MKDLSRALARAPRAGLALMALLAVTAVAAQPDRLTLGVYPGVESGLAESYQILDRYLPLAKYLSAKAGAEVLLVPVRVPDNVMQRIAEGKPSYKLFFGPPVFASDAIKKGDFVPVAVEQERIRGAFVVKSASRLKTIQDFGPGTRIAMPTQKLLLTILANESLTQQKIVLQPDARQYLGSTDGILHALDSGIVEVAVMRNQAATKLTTDKPNDYRIVGVTVDAPGFALIAHKSVSESVRSKVRDAVIALNGDASPLAAEARAGLTTSPLVAGRDDEFATLQRMMEAN